MNPSTDLEEKIARAIYEAYCARCIGSQFATWDTESEQAKSVARAQVQAAISVIREAGMVIVPRERNEAMLDAGTAVLWPPGTVPDLPGSTAVAVWNAMVAAGEIASSTTVATPESAAPNSAQIGWQEGSPNKPELGVELSEGKGMLA